VGRNVLVLVELAMLVYCLIDCIQSPSTQVRNLPKVVWVLLIVVLPLVGGIAWLVAGRPLASATRQVPWPSTRTAGFPEDERPRGPDDDPAFLSRIDRPDTKHEELLSQWEADLRERERRLSTSAPTDDNPPVDDAPVTDRPADGDADPADGSARS
jgi:hypothetical protein